jgi:hypothetical protein
MKVKEFHRNEEKQKVKLVKPVVWKSHDLLV